MIGECGVGSLVHVGRTGCACPGDRRRGAGQSYDSRYGTDYLDRPFQKRALCYSIFRRHLTSPREVYRHQMSRPASGSVYTCDRSRRGGIASCIRNMVPHPLPLPTIGLKIPALSLTGQNKGARRPYPGSAAQAAMVSCLCWALQHCPCWFSSTHGTVYGLFCPNRLRGQYLGIAALVLFRYVLLFVAAALLEDLKHPMQGIWTGFFRQIAALVVVFWFLAVFLNWKLPGIRWGLIFVTWGAAPCSWWYPGRVLIPLYFKTFP